MREGQGKGAQKTIALGKRAQKIKNKKPMTARGQVLSRGRAHHDKPAKPKKTYKSGNVREKWTTMR